LVCVETRKSVVHEHEVWGHDGFVRGEFPQKVQGFIAIRDSVKVRLGSLLEKRAACHLRVDIIVFHVEHVELTQHASEDGPAPFGAQSRRIGRSFCVWTVTI
jgi:hypothetical protein